MATKRTGRKVGRLKKPLLAIPEPKKAVGRPETLDLRHVAFYVAHSKLAKMRTTRGNRTLGAHSAALWLTALRKAGKDGLLRGASAGGVTGAPKDFISDCPDGFIPVVPLQPKQDSPITIEQVAGSARAMQKKAAEIFRSGDDATLRWFVEMVAIYGLILAGTNRADRGLWTEARGLWAEAGARAIFLGETEISSQIAHFSDKVEKFNPLAAFGVPGTQFPTA
jgi:hypothetical protein